MNLHIPQDPYAPFENKVCTQDYRFRVDSSASSTCAIDGDIFFSPNCTRPLELPKQTLTLPLNAKVDDPLRFLHPQWFSADAPHLAFFPLSPFSGDALDGMFSYFPALKISAPKGFSLDPYVLLKWNRLEFVLLLMAEFVLGKYHIPKPKDVINDVLICVGTYKTKSLLQKAVTKTVDWFSERAALMSYAIAVAQTLDDEQPTSFYPPGWFSYLANRDPADWDQALVSSVRTTMGQFSPWTRAGVILRVANPDRYQYSVDWLCKHNIPVWYPWGAKEIKAAESDPLLALLAPPVAEIQKAHTILHHSPVSHSQGQQAESTQPWISFFKERQRQMEIALKTEDPKRRQARENRERKPPVKNTKVFIWEEDMNGSYVRTKVPARWNEDRLADFGHRQCQYDAFNNEWDCGPFGDSDSESGGETDFGGDDVSFHPPINDVEMVPLPPVASTSSTTHVPPDTTSCRGRSPAGSTIAMTYAPISAPQQIPTQHQLTTRAQYCDEYEWDKDYECLEILKDFFGFVPTARSSRLRPPTTPITDQELKFITGIVGATKPEPGFKKLPLALEIMEFIRAFMANTVDSVPRNEIWDLAETNHRHVGGSWRFKLIRLHKTRSGIYYEFDFGDQHATVNWNLGVTNAVDALYICRLHLNMTDYDICRHLLQRGIQFHTFLPRKWTSVPQQIVAPPLPVRLKDYKFTQRDYEAYRSNLLHLLKNPRIARSALMKGGIIWRVVVSHVGFDDVFLGPTTNITLHSRGLCVDTGKMGIRLWDDDIAEEELDAIVGLHVCMTGQGDTHSLKSWWPTHTMWNANSPHSFWSPVMEQKFQVRLQELASGTAEPRTSSGWRSWVRGPGVVRTVTRANLKSAEALLERFCGDS